eukprot:jgi/Chlat1/6051/Chrsp4S06332
MLRQAAQLVGGRRGTVSGGLHIAEGFVASSASSSSSSSGGGWFISSYHSLSSPSLSPSPSLPSLRRHDEQIRLLPWHMQTRQNTGGKYPLGFNPKAFQPPVTNKTANIRIAQRSPNVLFDPYKPPEPKLPFFFSWFTSTGWKRRKDWILGYMKSAYTIARLRKNIPGFNNKVFKAEASDLYKQINSALARGDLKVLRDLVTDTIYEDMRREVKRRKDGGWTRVSWTLINVDMVKVLQGRLLQVEKDNADNFFGQLTVQVRSRQKFAVYDKKDKLVAGSPDEELLVDDFWVLERATQRLDARWRVAARLTF